MLNRLVYIDVVRGMIIAIIDRLDDLMLDREHEDEYGNRNDDNSSLITRLVQFGEIINNVSASIYPLTYDPPEEPEIRYSTGYIFKEGTVERSFIDIINLFENTIKESLRANMYPYNRDANLCNSRFINLLYIYKNISNILDDKSLKGYGLGGDNE